MLPKQTAARYILSSSPHAHAAASVHGMMRDVILALMPAACTAVWFFGMRAVWLIGVCIASCVATEALCRLAMKRESSVGDLSAVLTGLLLAFNLPPDLPLWMAVAGSVFAIAIAKQAFGGLGYNPFNPALAARAFMLVSFTGAMTTWSSSGWTAHLGHSTYATKLADAATGATPVAQTMLDGVTTATPLGILKTYATKPDALLAMDWNSTGLLRDLFVGNVNGCIGEVSALALLAGAAYLLIRRVITWHIPVSFIATVFLYALIKGGPIPPLVHVLSGGVILGACFMATDYVTSPITAKGKLIFGFGCGLITMLIRTSPTGAYPEGVSFSILVMNAVAPLIDRFTQPKTFGAKKKAAK